MWQYLAGYFKFPSTVSKALLSPVKCGARLWEVPACVLTLAGMGIENQHCSAGKSASISPENHHNVNSSTSRVEAMLQIFYLHGKENLLLLVKNLRGPRHWEWLALVCSQLSVSASLMNHAPWISPSRERNGWHKQLFLHTRLKHPYFLYWGWPFLDKIRHSCDLSKINFLKRGKTLR